jgi:hypothetical protein
MTKKKQNKIIDKINKVEESVTIYNKPETDFQDITEHPAFEKLVAKCVQDSKDGKLISHEEVRRNVRKKFPFLK